MTAQSRENRDQSLIAPPSIKGRLLLASSYCRLLPCSLGSTPRSLAARRPRRRSPRRRHRKNHPQPLIHRCRRRLQSSHRRHWFRQTLQWRPVALNHPRRTNPRNRRPTQVSMPTTTSQKNKKYPTIKTNQITTREVQRPMNPRLPRNKRRWMTRAVPVRNGTNCMLAWSSFSKSLSKSGGHHCGSVITVREYDR